MTIIDPIMPRKFKLAVYRKNQYKKKAHPYATPNYADVASLKVSLCIDCYMNASSPTVAILQQRIKSISVLPSGIVT